MNTNGRSSLTVIGRALGANDRLLKLPHRLIVYSRSISLIKKQGPEEEEVERTKKTNKQGVCKTERWQTFSHQIYENTQMFMNPPYIIHITIEVI